MIFFYIRQQKLLVLLSLEIVDLKICIVLDFSFVFAEQNTRWYNHTMRYGILERICYNTAS